MLNRIKLSLIVALTFCGIFFGLNHNTFAGDCYDANGDWYYCEDTSCANGATNPPWCDDNQYCLNGSSNPPQCDNVCQNGASNPPDCNDNNTCANGATNPPDCNNGTCPNGAIDFDTCSQCATGQAMVNGECVPESCTAPETGNYPDCGVCASGTTGTYPNCVCQNAAGNPPACDDYLCKDTQASNYNDVLPCKYDESPCCSDNEAMNFDPNCPDAAATPPQYSDASACSYCRDSSDPSCQVPYCSDMNANNPDTYDSCYARTHGNCYVDDSICTYPVLNYCDDPNATGPGTYTLADCQADKVSPSQQCSAFNTPTYCDYPAKTYCGDDRATNYDANGAQCQADNPGSTCSVDNNACIYAYCSIGFSLDITCPSGFEFHTPQNQSYYYEYQFSPNAPYYESCVGFTNDELTYLQNYFEQKYCGTGQSVTCQGDFCGNIDWCPNTPGVQTDPTSCVDVCPDKPGIQTSESECNPLVCESGSYYDQTTDSCVACAGGVCNAVSGACGTAATASYISDITGTKACQAGTASTVTLANKKFNWSCQGREGGTDASCQANLTCTGGKTYCENKGICSDKCYVGNDCANSNICVYNGNVALNTKLDVTPIINRGDTCVVNLDKTSEVFDAFNDTTHCVLSSQDGVITSFDPINLTSDGPGITQYSTANVKKDMTYTLKCHDGDITSTTTYATSVGSCRLNLRTLESN